MDRITAETHVDQILNEYPSLSKTFIEFGLPCMVCGQPFWGTIEALARQHNIDGSSLIKALNHKKREIDAKS
jgi:hypothetical protein